MVPGRRALRSSLTRAATLFAVTGMIATTTFPALSQNANGPAPIAIKSCRIDGSKALGSARLHILYKNAGKRPADRVAFAATYGGATREVVDTGSFAEDVTIDHTYNAFAGWPHGGPRALARCKVTSVHFTDGSSWP